MSAAKFDCPKCGAWAEMTYVRAVSAAELAEAVQAADRAREQMAAERKQPSYSSTMETHYWWRVIENHARRIDTLRHGSDGPWMDCSCPRCRYWWRERPLDARDADTPIYDSLAAP